MKIKVLGLMVFLVSGYAYGADDNAAKIGADAREKSAAASAVGAVAADKKNKVAMCVHRYRWVQESRRFKAPTDPDFYFFVGSPTRFNFECDGDSSVEDLRKALSEQLEKSNNKHLCLYGIDLFYSFFVLKKGIPGEIVLENGVNKVRDLAKHLQPDDPFFKDSRLALFVAFDPKRKVTLAPGTQDAKSLAVEVAANSNSSAPASSSSAAAAVMVVSTAASSSASSSSSSSASSSTAISAAAAASAGASLVSNPAAAATKK